MGKDFSFLFFLSFFLSPFWNGNRLEILLTLRCIYFSSWYGSDNNNGRLHLRCFRSREVAFWGNSQRFVLTIIMSNSTYIKAYTKGVTGFTSNRKLLRNWWNNWFSVSFHLFGSWKSEMTTGWQLYFGLWCPFHYWQWLLIMTREKKISSIYLMRFLIYMLP